MKKYFLFAFLFLCLFTTANGQIKVPVKKDSLGIKSPNTQVEKFVKSDSVKTNLTLNNSAATRAIDSADLKLTSCSFEKDANAMVLSDYANMDLGGRGIIMERHKRIKIFNINGKNEANIRIEYNNRYGAEHILAVVAQTINFNNGKIEYSKLDPSLIYSIHTDKQKDAIVFTMPNVKAGSVIQYSYIWERDASRNFPDWAFQCNLPTRYSQLNVLLNPQLQFKLLSRINQPFAKDTVTLGGLGHVWAMENIPASKNEPFMRSETDGVQKISFVLSGIQSGYQTQNYVISWADIGKQIGADKRFIKLYDENISDAGDILRYAKSLKITDEKIAYLFNQVKTLMKWNDDENWIFKNDIKTAWKEKTGNWGEINLIMYQLLTRAGIKAYPMLVSTRDNGAIYPDFPNFYQINKMVVYIPVDTANYYVLDATNRYNSYNEVPFDLLNSYGLPLDKDHDKYDLVYMKKTQPVRSVVLITAEINPDGTMNGTAELSSFSYVKANFLELHKTLDDKQYTEYLTDNDNNLTITDLQFADPQTDTLPLTQKMNFKLDLSVTDDQYIYFNPNLFTSLHTNPFINETRASDIDFGCATQVAISGRYKLPAGYKIESLPKSMNILMPDKSISFKRLVAEQEGYVVIHYVISYKNAVYSKDDYPNIYAYFKKMFEVLNEPIVLKKS